MAKKRIHQIAKELDVASADIVFLANELGIEVKTASSGLTPEEEELVLLAFNEQNVTEDSTTDDTVEIIEETDSTDSETQETQTDEKDDEQTDTESVDIQIIEVPSGCTPEELSSIINIDATQIVGDLMSLGIMQSMTSQLKDKEIETLLEKYDLMPEIVEKVEIKRSEILALQEFQDEEQNLTVRSPIITVMGHVDHGKTSLLDYIRNEKVADGEAGGITQHVGAYKVESGDLGITFIDTPGHEAFTQMRARGANVTDIVVLVVAADDGIMPQTIEAINHSKAAGVPIVVAVNKCDLPDANPALVKADLTKYEIIAEDLGGDTPVVEVSALKGDGVDDLLETLSLVAEIEELKANPNTNASGYIESRMEVGRGNVATVVVTRGTLKQGDFLYAGGAFCRVKSMFDHTNKVLKNVIPGSPVDIIGWDESPNSGDQFVAVKSQKEAKAKAEQNKTLLKDFDSSSYTVQSRVSEMMQLLQEGELNTINVILKADTNGSVEAIKDGLLKLSSDEVQIEIVHSAVGGIVLSDVDLAGATNSLIVGFNVRPDSQARNMAQSKGIDVRTYQIIYELLDDITEALQGEMTIKTEEAVIGMVDVRTTFRAPKVGIVAGSIVTEGRVEIDSKARLLRDGVVIYEGTVTSLRRFKDNVEKVLEGLECGIGLTDYKDIKEGDVIEILGEVEIK